MSPRDLSSAAAAAAPRQRWTTRGITALNRGGVLTRLFMGGVALAERMNRRYAKFGNPCVYDTALFPWVAEIERDWRVIRGELDRVLARKSELPPVQEITADAAGITRDSGWKIFLLAAYGVESPRSIELCPETWRIVRKIPGLKTAMFSILEPGKRLPPHRGPYNGVLRLHLGLWVPEPRERQAIRIGFEQHCWREGAALVFDDAYEHEAWNETSQHRVVLFVDFAKPLRFPANWLNRMLLSLSVFSPFVRDAGTNLRKWEATFYASRDPAGGQSVSERNRSRSRMVT